MFSEKGDDINIYSRLVPVKDTMKGLKCVFSLIVYKDGVSRFVQFIDTKCVSFDRWFSCIQKKIGAWAEATMESIRRCKYTN